MSNDNKSLAPHPSLPAKPPASVQPKPSYNASSAGAPGYGNNSSAPGYGSNANGGGYGAYSQAPNMNYQSTYAGAYDSNGYANSTYYPPSNSYSPAVPVITNPFANQGTRGYGKNGYDPEQEAQLAEWNSAYAPKDDKKATAAGNANGTPLGSRPGSTAPFDVGTPGSDGDASASAGTRGPERARTVVRHGGGKTWEDESLLDWPEGHPRLFIGNLAGEVTDDSLFKAFSKYSSVSKARVVRDKHTTKSKSFGFVSFGNTDDFFRAAKEMQGKYIGSHPVIIKRANVELKPSFKKQAKAQDRNRKNNRKDRNSNGKDVSGQGGAAAGPTATLYAGVQKYPAKVKGGPKVLG